MKYISRFSDIGLYLEDYLMYKAVTLARGMREPLLTCSSSVTWETVSICHGCMVLIEKSVTRVTDWHHEAFRVMPNSDLE